MLILGLLIIILNFGDALLTRYEVSTGMAKELNPLMAALIEYDLDVFVFVKHMWVTILVMFVLDNVDKKWCRQALWITFGFYSLVILYHIAFLVQLSWMTS